MALFSSIFSPTLKEKNNSEILSPEFFKRDITANKVQLVDLRTPREFNSGHIQGAVNIDYFDQEFFRGEFEKFDKDKPLYIYCRSGNRSQQAARRLTDMGFREIYDLAGGIQRWY